ncbi:reverse transcriptase [Tanacetum coccineum]|uniref:Reverse transcriptase n=1 Tax=Tanacetum coccineum TaxID=301880 RepID=A0ABQ4ZUV3_9ASTR
MVNTHSTDTGGVLTNPNPSMESLVEIVTRLANTVVALENRINNVELKNLKQTTTVHGYQDSFEELLNKVELNEAYAVSLFVGRLKEDIAYAVRMIKPTGLSDVFCLSKLQKANNSVTATTMPVQNNTTVPNRPFKRLTQQELEEKRAKHLRFYCDQKYMPGHKCSGQVFSLEVIGTNLDEDDELLLTEHGVVNTFHSLVDEQPLISLNALTRLNAYRTMRVKGCVGKNALHVLVDSGSTHHFLNLQIAKKLGCRLRKICPLDVSVANGNVMSSTYECKGFTWVFQGVTYTADVMISPLGDCDMVLGIQWLATLGDI